MGLRAGMIWALEWHAMRSNRRSTSLISRTGKDKLAGRLGLIACLAWVLVPAGAHSQQAESPTVAARDLPAAEASVDSTSPEAPGSNGRDSVANNAFENPETEVTPIDNVDTARPSLDYEPTETISEDSSVSFPVDI